MSKCSTLLVTYSSLATACCSSKCSSTERLEHLGIIYHTDVDDNKDTPMIRSVLPASLKPFQKLRPLKVPHALLSREISAFERRSKTGDGTVRLEDHHGFCVQSRVAASTYIYAINFSLVHPLSALPRPLTLRSSRRDGVKYAPIKHPSNILFHHAPIFRPQHKPRRRPCACQ